jgi:putative PEP-CTERM system TPR-repeat lipoprotein
MPGPNVRKVARSSGAVVVLTALTSVAILASSGCSARVTPAERVATAREHMSKGAMSAAVVELKSALQEAPQNADARLALAEASYWLGDLDSAAKEIERARSAGAPEERVLPLQYEILLTQRSFDAADELLKRDSHSSPLRKLTVAARIDNGRGNAAAAEEKLTAALHDAPDDPEALLELARLKAQRGDRVGALDTAARVTGSAELAGRAALFRGQLLMLGTEYQAARDMLAKLLEDPKVLRAPDQLAAAVALTETNIALADAQAAEAGLAKVASMVPNSAITHYLRARIAMLRRDAAGAVAEAQLALQVDPKHEQSQLLLATAHLAQGATEQAEHVLHRLLASSPGNSAARKLLANIYLQRNEADKARDVLAAAAADRGDPQVDWLMGAALLGSGMGAEGLEHLERSVAADSGNAQRKLTLAGAYIAAGATDKAVALLEGFPSESALAPQARRLLVLATAAGKPSAQARAEIEELVKKNGNDGSLLSAAGSYFAATGDAVSARQVLERALKVDPKSVDARMTLARLDAAALDVGNSERLLREVIQIDSRYQAAYLALAQLAWSGGNRAQARKWLEQAITAYPAAVDARLRLAQFAFVEGDAPRGRGLLDQAVRVASGDRGRVLAAVGNVLAAAKLTDEALAKFQEASAAGNRDATLAAARLHLQLDQRAQARDLLTKAVAEPPKWPEAERMLVITLAADGDVDGALARAKTAFRDAPAPAMRELEGDIYATARRSAEAIAAYEQAQKAQPSAAVALKIFRVRRSAGEPSAESSLVQWLQRTPEDAQVRSVLAAYYESAGDTGRAVQEYEKLLAANAITPALLNNLAWALHQKGDPRALELARRAQAAAPSSGAIADTYGWILVQMGKVQEGRDMLEMAVSREPSNPEILYHAAVAYSKSGQVSRARELLQSVLKSPNQFASRADAERLARTLSE